MDALNQYLSLYRECAGQIDSHAPALMNGARALAYERLQHLAFPDKGQERYPAISINDIFTPDYGINVNRVEFPVDTASTFHCGVPNISTLLGLVVNDTFRATASLQRNLPEGVLMMSLAEAAAKHTDLVARYIDALIPKDNAAAQLNTLLLQDGVFIYVPDDTVVSRSLQLVNIFNSAKPIMGTRRVVIVLGARAQASLLVCDHSQLPEVPYLSNQVVEIYLGDGAHFEYYDLEESSIVTSRVSQLYASQQSNSQLTVNGTTLIGGKTRNNYYVDINGRGTETHLVGMAIGADDQIVDNNTYVHHKTSDCMSRQMFKYVLDDKAVGSFYGTIVVDEGAKFTNAYQSNRNILASRDARMYTRPQLEIYCDEVKCSHGATIGQLDQNALFYMRSRGIPVAEARLMLMQAFMSDVIDTVSIPALKTRLMQLVESRLNGNRTLCAECLH